MPTQKCADHREQARRSRADKNAKEPSIQHDSVDGLHGSDPLRGWKLSQRLHHERREGEENTSDQTAAERSKQRQRE
jgi:hypothetical protein